MTWRPWWRPTPARQPHPRPDAAKAALRAIRAETPRYRALAEELRRMREANHFAEAIARAIKEGH